MGEFARKLKSLRTQRGWSQEELAERLQISRSTIGNYEQGTRNPSYEDLEAIADVFNCTMGYLIEPGRVGPDDYVVMEALKNETLRDRLLTYAKFLLSDTEGPKNA